MSAQRSLPSPELLRLSVEQYEAMGRAGILRAEDKVELLEGLLVRKMTKHPPHRIATRQTRVALESIVGVDFYVDTQEPIVTADSSPEPDVAVIRGDTRDYADHNPPASAVALVVEVADDSIRDDRGVKARIYARASVPVYWIVNVRDRTLEVYERPSGEAPEPAYGARRFLSEDDQVDVVLEGQIIGTLAVRSLLP
jgi:Uma2 family endonuclease